MYFLEYIVTLRHRALQVHTGTSDSSGHGVGGEGGVHTGHAVPVCEDVRTVLEKTSIKSLDSLTCM